MTTQPIATLSEISFETPTEPQTEACGALVRASLVPAARRPHFLPKAFGTHSFVRGENAVYMWMSRLSLEYKGGFWDFFELSNGGFFMAPSAGACAVRDGAPSLMIVCQEGNGYEGCMSGQAAGIVATAFALNHLLFTGHPQLEVAYHQLMDFVYGHPEATAIRSALD